MLMNETYYANDADTGDNGDYDANVIGLDNDNADAFANNDNREPHLRHHLAQAPLCQNQNLRWVK